MPQVPEPRTEDPEDVSWALSTAEAMWARGDHAEGIKWIRRAAEAASEAENDTRALELAKAAADLTGLISRMSRASIDVEITPASEPMIVIPGPPPLPAPRMTKPPIPKPSPGSVTRQVATPSRPPAPLPSRTSQPPPRASQPPSGHPSQPPPGRASQPPRAGKPFGTNTSSKPPSMRPGALKTEPKKTSRKSHDALPAMRPEPPALNVSDTAPHPVMDERAALQALAPDTMEMKVAEPVKRRDANADATMVGSVDEIQRAAARSATEWDADMTQNLVGEDFSDGDRKTTVGIPPAAGAPPLSAPVPSSGTNPPATVVGSRLPNGNPAVLASRSPSVDSKRGSVAPSDPGIVTSQAVRVVVWRDASGVHVAPAGTVVSAIAVDAVLVALESTTDLTAWLTAKGR